MLSLLSGVVVNICRFQKIQIHSLEFGVRQARGSIPR